MPPGHQVIIPPGQVIIPPGDYSMPPGNSDCNSVTATAACISRQCRPMRHLSLEIAGTSAVSPAAYRPTCPSPHRRRTVNTPATQRRPCTPEFPAGFVLSPPHDGRSDRIPSPSPPTRPHPNPFAQALAPSPQARLGDCLPARHARSTSAFTQPHPPAGHAARAVRPTRRSASSCPACLR